MSSDKQFEQSPRPWSGAVLADISNAMVKLYKEQFGRGPTQARSGWLGDDTLVVVLEDTLSPTERSLVKIGEHQRLREMRLVFQYANVPRFCEPVERLTGRKVRSFLSSTDTEVDGLSTEMFVLHPEGYLMGRHGRSASPSSERPPIAASPRWAVVK